MAEPTVQAEIQKKSLENTGVDQGSLKGQTAAEKMRQTLQERGHRAVLEDARAGKRGVTGSERDRTVSQFDTVTDQDTARDQIDTMNRFLTEGYSGLPPHEQDARRDEVLDAMLVSHVMGDSMRGLSPAEAEAYTEGVLQDKHFQAIVNQRMQNISERQFSPTKDQMDNRIAVIRASNPTMDKATARTTALGALQTEFRADLQRDLDNVIGHSAHALIRENLDAANDIVIKNAASLDKEVNDSWSDGIAQRLEARWSGKDAYKKKGEIRGDWEKFAANGLDGLSGMALRSEEIAYLNSNPELKKKMEEQIGQSLIMKRMRAGVLKKDDMYRLADAKWMGDTPSERIDKVQEIFEAHATLKDLISQGQEQGFIDKDVWDKIKAAGPYAAGGMLVAILAMLALPLSAAGTLITAAGIGGGAAAGAAKFKFGN